MLQLTDEERMQLALERIARTMDRATAEGLEIALDSSLDVEFAESLASILES